MKRLIHYLQGLAVVLFCTVMSLTTYAQEGGGGGADIKVDINKDSNDWYTQPWVWIVGGAVFILLLVALLRRGNDRDA